MSAPYRSSGGRPCPRCTTPLTREGDDELVCTEGCGMWLGNPLLPLDPASLVSLSAAHPPINARALPFTRCLECNRSLTDLYKGVVDVLALGQCLEHGVWIERGDRAVFEAMYADELRAYAAALRVQQAEQAREHAEQAQLASLPPAVADLMKRVATLERTVTAMARELAALRARQDD